MKKLLLLILIFSGVSTLAQIPARSPNTYVNDYAGVLSKDDIAKLNASIYQLEKKTSVQLAIVLINDLPENYVVEDYAREIGEKWGVGNAQNGLVYVAVINAHKQRLEVARNLEGDIPDVTALDITDNMKPFFRNKDYAGGLQELVKQVTQHTDPVAKEQLRLAQLQSEKESAEAWRSIGNFCIWFFPLLAVVFLGLYFFVWRPRKKRREAEEAEADRLYQASLKSSYRSRHNFNLDDIPTLGTEAALMGAHNKKKEKKKEEEEEEEEDTYTPPPYIPPPSTSNDEDTYSSKKDDDNDNNFGNFGGGGGGGFGGGGASNDW